MANRIVKIVCLLLILCSITQTQVVWKENSFQDFQDGTFTDAGSNLYVSAAGRIQMITRWDFDNDGNLDILLSAGHGHTEKENIFVYFNNGSDVDGRSRIELPGGGSRDGLVCDFNKDGFNDLAVANSSDSHFSRVNSWIFYGSETGLKIEDRVALPAYRGRSIIAGDFNNDSWTDLAIACQWQAGTVIDPEGPVMSFIYWNSENGFDPDNRLQLLPGQVILDLAAQDLDGDNKVDLITLTKDKTCFFLSTNDDFNNGESFTEFSQGGSSLALGNTDGNKLVDLVVCDNNKVLLYNDFKNGSFAEKKHVFDVSSPIQVVCTDLDQDGMDEIIVASFSTPGGATWTNSLVLTLNKQQNKLLIKQKLPSLGASDIFSEDLNSDGFPELIVCNQRITNQLNINSYIYWNDSGKLYFGNHSQLPTLGVMAGTTGDINNDGKPDLVFFNEEGYFRDGPTISKINWGSGTRMFPESQTTEFHTHHIFGHGHADLDDDGQLDLVLSQERFVQRVTHEQNGLIIYWGEGSRAFSSPSFLTMNTAYGGVRIADINKDGYLDLLAGGDCIDLNQPDKHGIAIFWGSETGYQNSNRLILHHQREKIRAPLLMDLNRDGWLDITGQVKDGEIIIWWGAASGLSNSNYQVIDLERPDHLMYIKGADFNKDGWLDLLLPKRRPHEEHNTSFVYYGSRDGFSNSNRIEIYSNIAYENTICDFNQDGWLDIFLTSYGTDLKGNRPSVIHWGSAGGFHEKPYSLLATHGTAGSEGLDYDGDGWIDILVANHRKAGSTVEPIPHEHTTPAQLFWGGPEGFSDDRQLLVPAVGPSGLNVRDLGNSYDRGLYEDYVSSVYTIEDKLKPASISWLAEKPFDSSVKFQIRISDQRKNLKAQPWTGPDGENSWYTKSGSSIKNQSGKFIQYKARLTTDNGAATPYLETVSVTFK